MEKERSKILYIDDESPGLFNFEQLFHDDFEVYTAISAAKGLEILSTNEIQIIICDQRMPDKTGIEFFAEVAELYPDTIRILLTAYSEASVIIDAINIGQVYQYITKPFEYRNVKNILQKAIRQRHLKNENEALVVRLQKKNAEYEAINEELRQTIEQRNTGNKRIEDLVKRFSLAQEVSAAGTWDWDIQKNIFFWSDEFLKLFGMEPGTVPGFEAWTKSLHPDDIESASKRIQDAIDQKKDLLSHYRVILPDGNIKWIRAVGKVTYLNEVPVRMIGLCIDVTDRKQAEQNVLDTQAKLSKALDLSNQSRQTLLSVLEDKKEAEREIQRLNAELEQRVFERTGQLEAANKELEAFSYSVSHDLRAPLRHINGFAQILKEQYSGQLTEDAVKQLGTIISAANKMGILIDDLLSFARTGRAELKRTSLKMNAVIEDALGQVKTSIKDRKIVWNISPLPEVAGDYNLMRMVWINLIDNAVKYTSNRKNTTIEVGYREEEKEIVFYIKDNGVGFDMKYAHKLFEVFQRLHSSPEFEGTGIGLANVRRIIQRHGGRVWAESQADKGATFYFSVPK